MLYSDYPTARLHLSTLVQGGQCLSGARASLVPTEECFSCYITCRASRPTSLKITPLPITARRVCAAGALLVISSNSGMSHFMTSLGQARESVVVTMRTTVTDCNRTLVQRRMKLMIFRLSGSPMHPETCATTTQTFLGNELSKTNCRYVFEAVPVIVYEKQFFTP